MKNDSDGCFATGCSCCETETLSSAGASTSGIGGLAFASSLLVSGPVCGVVMGIVFVSEGLDVNDSWFL
jgi:cytoskeletal protein CcmA (bactofilin family)